MAQRSLNRRSRSRDEDEEYSTDNHRDEDDAPPPRRGRSRRDEEDDTPAPSRGRSRRHEEDDEPPARRRGRRDPDEDEERTPRSSSRRSRDEEDEPRPKASGKGWGAFKAKREEYSDFLKPYKLPEDQKEIIKILDEEPFAVYSEHWLDERSGKKSFTCLGDDCPLCNVGDKARVYALFNIVDLRDPEDPKVSFWKCSQTVADILEGYAQDPKTSPINRFDLYWSIQKTGGGKKGRVQTHLNPVKARDLLDDWDIEPLSEEEIEEFEDKAFEEDAVIEYSSRKALREIADDLD